MNKLIERFRKELAELANYKDTTVAAYISAVYSYESYAANSLGIEISQSNPYHVTRWFASLRDNKGYGSSFLHTHKVSVKKYFDFLIVLGVIDKNPAVHLPPVKGVQRDLKKNRDNCGTSINRKLFSLRSYSNHLKLLDINDAEELPFKNVLKIRGGYKSDPQALTTDQIQNKMALKNKSQEQTVSKKGVFSSSEQLNY